MHCARVVVPCELSPSVNLLIVHQASVLQPDGGTRAMGRQCEQTIALLFGRIVLDVAPPACTLFSRVSFLRYVLLRSLTVPPESDETMRLDFTIVSLPGNPINLTNYITINPSEVYYTAFNWSTEVVLLVDGTSECHILPKL